MHPWPVRRPAVPRRAGCIAEVGLGAASRWHQGGSRRLLRLLHLGQSGRLQCHLVSRCEYWASHAVCYPRSVLINGSSWCAFSHRGKPNWSRCRTDAAVRYRGVVFTRRPGCEGDCWWSCIKVTMLCYWWRRFVTIVITSCMAFSSAYSSSMGFFTDLLLWQLRKSSIAFLYPRKLLHQARFCR